MISHSDHFDHSEVWSKISTFFCSTSWYMPKAAHFSHCGVSSKMCIPLMPWAITNNSDHSSQTPASSAYIACLHATPIETSREKQYVISIWKIVLLKKIPPKHNDFLIFPNCSWPFDISYTPFVDKPTWHFWNFQGVPNLLHALKGGPSYIFWFI